MVIEIEFNFFKHWLFTYVKKFVFTVKPVLSGHPLLSGQKPKSPNLFPLFTLYETFTKRTPLLRGRGHLKVPEMVISNVFNLY